MHRADSISEEGIHTGTCDIETALNHVGVGPFQWAALAVCGLANAADAVEILGMSLVLPAAEADPGFELGPAGKSALSSCIFLGMLAGGLLWGPMGDALGRRSSLLVALLLNAFFGLMSAGARGVGPLVALRLLGGVGVGGSVPVVFSFLAELLPARARGRYMVGLAAHWMVGSIFSAGMGWAIIPTGPGRWRLFLAVASLPAWCAALGAALLPESPRFLLVQGRTEAAEQVLHRMAATNRTRLAAPIRLQPHKSHHMPLAPTPGASRPASAAAMDAPGAVGQPPTAAVAAGAAGSSGGGGRGSAAGVQHVRAVRSSAGGSSAGSLGPRQQWGSGAGAGAGAAGGSSSSSSAPRGPSLSGGGSTRQWKQQQRRCCRASWVAAKMLLQPPLRRRFLPLLVAWLGLCGGWYSTVLWIPEFFKARGAQSASLYAETFAVAASNLPGNVASVFMVDRLGRRLTACLCLAGACVAALGFAFAPPRPLWSVAAACIFNGISVGGWNALDLLSAELFATEVRSTAMGLLGASGRLAAFSTTFLAGVLMQVLVWAPLLVASGLLAAGSVAIMLLPEMAHRPLEDTVEDAEDAEVTVSMLTAASHSEQAAGVTLHQWQQQQAARASAGGGGGNGVSFGQQAWQQPPPQQQQQGPGPLVGLQGVPAAAIELQQAPASARLPAPQGSTAPQPAAEERLGLLAAASAPREPG